MGRGGGETADSVNTSPRGGRITGRKNRKNRILKCMTLNAQSIINKFSEFKLIISDQKPHIISITESWGQDWHPDSLFALDGYTLYRNDRQTARGGGTLLYISNTIEQRVCRPLNVQDFENSTWCWIVGKGGKKTLVGSIYRSPNSTPANNARLMEKIEKANDLAGDNRLLMMGDFNVPKIEWSNKDLLPEARRIEIQMLDVINDCFLHQHVKEPTRFRNNDSSTLDLIFTKEEEDVKNIKVLQPLGRSDHGIVTAEYICEWKHRVVKKPRRIYHKGNFEKILEGLEQINWVIEFEEKTVQECWDIFKTKLEVLLSENIPMSNPKDYNEPWMNRTLIKKWRKKVFCLEKIH